MQGSLDIWTFISVALGGVALWTLGSLSSTSPMKFLAGFGRLLAWAGSLVVLRYAIQGEGQLVELIGIALLASLAVYVVGLLLGQNHIKGVGSSWFVPLLLILLVRTGGWEPYRIPSGSMLPTLVPGDYILVNRHVYGVALPYVEGRLQLPNSRLPLRGEIIVFNHPDTGITLVKRLIGLPGDRIEMRAGQLWVNDVQVQSDLLSSAGDMPEVYGESLSEEGPHRIQRLIPRRSLQLTSGDESWTVPENEYFLLGDNRDNSRDSRAWGTVPVGNLIGQLSLVWMRWQEGDFLPSFGYEGELR